MAQVSDHAVLRYIERILLIDVDAIRAHLDSPAVATAASFGCETVVMHDCRLRLKGDTVATVIPKRRK